MIFATAILGIWSVANFLFLGGSIGQIMQRNYRSVKAAQMMSGAIERQDSAELMYLFGHRQEAEKLFASAEVTFLEYYGRAKDNITEPGEPEIIDSIGTLYPEYLLLFDKLRNSDIANEGEFYLTEIKPVFDRTQQAINTLLEINQNAMLKAEQAAEDRSDYAVYSSLIVATLVIIFGLFFGLKLSQIIIRPLEKVIVAARQIGEGRLDLSVEAESEDEIGLLAQEFNKMATRLREYRAMNLERLLAEQKKADVIVNTIRDCILVTDQENRVTLLNPAAERLFGTTTERAEGKHFLEVIKDDALFQLGSLLHPRSLRRLLPLGPVKTKRCTERASIRCKQRREGSLASSPFCRT
jgi:NtrC-family two-component system sensor histidine kinase KinB